MAHCSKARVRRPLGLSRRQRRASLEHTRSASTKHCAHRRSSTGPNTSSSVSSWVRRGASVSVAASINVCRIPSASLQADSVPTVKSALVDASRSRQPRPAPRVSRDEGVVARCAASPLRCQDRASEAQRASGEGRRGSAVAVHTRREPTTHENEHQVREQTETRLAKRARTRVGGLHSTPAL